MEKDSDAPQKKIFVYAYPDHKDSLSLLGSAFGVGVIFKIRKIISSVVAMCTSDMVGASNGACGHMYWPEHGRRTEELSSWVVRNCPLELSVDGCDVYMRGTIHGVVSGFWETVLFVGVSILLVGSFHGLVFCSAERVRKLLTWLTVSATVAVLV